MTAAETIKEIVDSMVLVALDDVEELIEELDRLGFEIVRKQTDE